MSAALVLINLIMMKRYLLRLFVSIVTMATVARPLFGQDQVTATGVKLENPISETYLKTNLRQTKPRLVLSPKTEGRLREKLESDPVIANFYDAIKKEANHIYDQPLLVRKQIGRRLLSVSREMLFRMNMLGLVYRIERDSRALNRINEEVLAVSRFADWNPSHFLDVGEMAMAVAIALDWTAGALPEATIVEAETALIEKGIKPSWPANGKQPGWVYSNNNWNQVCHGGLIAAAIAVAERDPALAAQTISRALEALPNALQEYAPDGVYPEGSTYWEYGTGFSVVTIAMLESAFGTDFGYGDYPGFLESALFRVMTNAPSGMYYNFADCGDRRSDNGDVVLAWFAQRTGNTAFYEKNRFSGPVAEMSRLSRLAGCGLVWMSQINTQGQEQIPLSWAGKGANPVVIFKDDASRQYYFGGKGGRGSVNHGNMDGGSFVFELDGVRWVVDPGNQDYEALEKTGFDLWGRCQKCERWTLLTKNNFGHSTLTINRELHQVNGMSLITDFRGGERPEATIDMTAAFGADAKSVKRKFIRDGPFSLTVIDEIIPAESTEEITWQLLTTAEVEINAHGANLRQDGKVLKILNKSHPGLQFSVVSLDPPPLDLDRRIEGLKRLELKIRRTAFRPENERIEIRLTGD